MSANTANLVNMAIKLGMTDVLSTTNEFRGFKILKYTF